MVRRFFFASFYVGFVFLFMVTFFEAGRIVLQHIRSAQKRLAIQVYLKKDLNEQEKLDIGKTLVKLAGVERVEYIAGDEAKLQFVRSYPEYEKIIDLFKKIPLPEGYRISVAPQFLREPYIDHLIGEISMISGVEEVAFKREWARKLSEMERIFDIAGALYAGLVVIAIVLVFPFVVGYVLTWRTRQIPMFGQPAGAVILGVFVPTFVLWAVEKVLVGLKMSKDTWTFALVVAVLAAIASEIVLRVCLKPSEMP